MARRPDPVYPDFPPGYLDPTDSIRSAITNPAPDPNADLKALLAQIAAGQPQLPMAHPSPPTLGQRFGPLPVPAMPRSSNERDVGGRSFLSGLVQGFNNKSLAGVGGKPGKGTLAGAGTQVDPLLADKHALYLARTAAAQSLANKRSAPDQPDPTLQAHLDVLAAEKDAFNALAQQRRSRLGFKPSAGGGGGGRGGAGGVKAPTYSQVRAGINARAQAEKQRLTSVLTDRYKDVWDYTDAAGNPHGKEKARAAISRALADNEMRHRAALQALDEKYGVSGSTISPQEQGGAAAPAIEDPYVVGARNAGSLQAALSAISRHVEWAPAQRQRAIAAAHQVYGQ